MILEVKIMESGATCSPKMLTYNPNFAHTNSTWKDYRIGGLNNTILSSKNKIIITTYNMFQIIPNYCILNDGRVDLTHILFGPMCFYWWKVLHVYLCLCDYEQDMWIYKLNIAFSYLSPHSVHLWIHLKMGNYHTKHIRLAILVDWVNTYGVYGKRWGPYLIPIPVNPRSTWERSHVEATNMGTILLNLVRLDRSTLS